jgi:6-pyruvoyl-tetrahydropterin synthase
MEILAIKYYDLIEKQLDFAYLIDSLANKNQYLEMMIKLTAKINSERMNKILGKTSVLFRF